jgi:histone H3/H4
MSNFDLAGSPLVPGEPESMSVLDSALSRDLSSMSMPASDAKHLLPESVKVIAETVGLSGLSDEVARELAEDATFRLKTLLQDAHKFMVHAKRKQLLCEDIDLALRSEGEILLLPKHSDHQSFYLYIVSIKFGFRDKVCVCTAMISHAKFKMKILAVDTSNTLRHCFVFLFTYSIILVYNRRSFSC